VNVKKVVKEKNHNSQIRENDVQNVQSSLKSVTCGDPYLLTKDQLSFQLQISVPFIDKLMGDKKKRRLPHFKIGRSVRFKKEEVMAFLERRRRP
jgi:excisionase family DNA binding protein